MCTVQFPSPTRLCIWLVLPPSFTLVPASRVPIPDSEDLPAAARNGARHRAQQFWGACVYMCVCACARVCVCEREQALSSVASP